MGMSIMTDFEVSLREKGYKLTGQRQIIWRVMREHSGEHLSIKEIWQIAKEKDDSIGTATVYRTVQLMDELGIVSSFDKKDQLNKYELVSSEEDSMHPHLICRQCGKIIGIAENLLIRDPQAAILNEYNFKIEDIRVKCYGLCQKCAQESINPD